MEENVLERFGERWKTFNFIATKDLGDGTYLLASITQSPEINETNYYTVIYRVEHNRATHRNILRRETFSNIWDAVRYCETVDLGDLETTNE